MISFKQSLTLRVVVADKWQSYFNVMLKDMGVRGVKIQEVFSMDADMLAILPYVIQPSCRLTC